jgi:hypothetical protein
MGRFGQRDAIVSELRKGPVVRPAAASHDRADPERLLINVAIGGRTIGLRYGEIKLSAPFGFASYATTGALRKIEYRVMK